MQSNDERPKWYLAQTLRGKEKPFKRQHEKAQVPIHLNCQWTAQRWQETQREQVPAIDWDCFVYC